MTASSSRWQRVLGIVVTLIMVFALAAPNAVNATKAPAPQAPARTEISDFHAARFVGQTNGTAAQIAERLYGPSRGITETLTGKGTGPFKEQVGSWNLPWAKSRRNTTPRVAESNTANKENRKRIYDEEPSPELFAFWEGLNQGSNRTLFGFGFLPPDTTGDTSGNVYNSGYYVQTVNTTMAVWDYSQANLYGGWPKTVLGPMPINELWAGTNTSCEYTNDGDPIVRYDEQAGRWLISQFALPIFAEYAPGSFLYPDIFPYAFAECIAISQTDDPTGGYYLYEFASPLTSIDHDGDADTAMVGGYKMPDYPKFGVYSNAYYMSVNQFDEFGFNWAGAGMYAFERDAMLVGGPADMVYFDPYAAEDCSAETLYTTETSSYCFMGGMLPADNDGSFGFGTSGGWSTYFMQFDEDAWSTPAYTTPDALEIWEMGVDWGVSAWVGGPTLLTVDPFDSDLCGYSRNCIDQPVTAVGLAAISDRLMDRLNYRVIDRSAEGGPIYEVMVTNHTVDVNGADQAGVRWYELRRYWNGVSYDPWFVYQQGTYAPDGNSRWMGSMAVDAVGNLALGYSVSGAATYPTIRYTTHKVGDPLGTMRDEVAITSAASAAGAQTSTSYRWGDYSSMTVADGTGCDFIFTSEYLRGTTGAEWYTRMGNFGFDNCFANDVEGPELFWLSTPPDPDPLRDGEFQWDVFYDQWGVDYYQCSLDHGAWFTCSTPYFYTGLASGWHHFEVRGVDVVGNIGEPITHDWEIIAQSSTFVSAANADGYLYESSENSNVGGTGSTSAGSWLYVGDQIYDRQVKSVFSFNVTLPPGAIVTGARIQYFAGPYVGQNPFATHGPLLLDIANPYFGGAGSLVASDFEASASAYDVAFCPPTTIATNLYACYIDPSYLFLVGGSVQFRMGFTLDDNDDNGADMLKIYSGNYLNPVYRPILVVDYYIP